MKIIVCMKQILDPEVPTSKFTLDAEQKAAARNNTPLVTNIFDEHALEVALQLRESVGEGEITLLSIGPRSAEDVLRKGLAMKADDAVLIACDNLLELNPLAVAKVLAVAIKKLDGFDLVLCGRESGDWNSGHVGGMLAEEIGLPYVPFVASIEEAGANLRLRAQTDDGWDIVEARRPVLATITNHESNVPRIRKIRDVILASRREVKTWAISTLGIDAAAFNQPHTRGDPPFLFIPVKKGTCEFPEQDSPHEKVSWLCERLGALKTI